MVRYISLPHFCFFLTCNGQLYFISYRPLGFSEYTSFPQTNCHLDFCLSILSYPIHYSLKLLIQQLFCIYVLLSFDKILVQNFNKFPIPDFILQLTSCQIVSSTRGLQIILVKI